MTKMTTTQLTALSANQVFSLLTKGKVVSSRAGKITVQESGKKNPKTFILSVAPQIAEEVVSAEEQKTHKAATKTVRRKDAKDTLTKRRGPGRPRKTATKDSTKESTKDSTKESAKESAPKKRGPGRPKKAVSTESSGKKPAREKKTSTKGASRAPASATRASDLFEDDSEYGDE